MAISPPNSVDQRMPQLLFKREFFDAIRRGRKTTTLRRWKRCPIWPGGHATTPGLGVLKILDCRRVQLQSLREADARADGFACLADLRQTLKRFYPNQAHDGKHWYKVTFQLQREAPARPPQRPKPTLRGQKARLARRVRAELDKAVRSNGLLFPL